MANQRTEQEQRLSELCTIFEHTAFIDINQPDLLSHKVYDGLLTMEDFKTIDYSAKSEPDLEQLKSVFVSFCSFSSPLVIDRLTQQNFLRLLKNCRIFEDGLISVVPVHSFTRVIGGCAEYLCQTNKGAESKLFDI